MYKVLLGNVFISITLSYREAREVILNDELYQFV